MPHIVSGSLHTMGIWPNPENKDLGNNQAVYVTMFKRHFDPVCIASVYINWPDETRWILCVNNRQRIVIVFDKLTLLVAATVPGPAHPTCHGISATSTTAIRGNKNASGWTTPAA